jgi:hypothetical protein
MSSGILTDITFLELFPVVIALNIWGESLRNRFVLFHIDNQAVMSIITKKSSRSPRVMSLVRKLVFACLKFNILIKTEHIPDNLNSLADSLSRFSGVPEVVPSSRGYSLYDSVPPLEHLNEEVNVLIDCSMSTSTWKTYKTAVDCFDNVRASYNFGNT